jgi:hypothetical protein
MYCSQLALFCHTDWGFLCVVFHQLYKKCQYITRKDEARAALSSDMAVSPKCLIFAESLTLDMTNLGSNPKETYNQIYAPHYCLLSNGFQFLHIEVFNRDGKLVSVSAIPVIF